MDKNQASTSLCGFLLWRSSFLPLVISKVGRMVLDLRPPPGYAGGAVAPPASECSYYRLRLTRSFSISSETVITRELAWKPRWAMIMFVNS
jgi:hypothetical protein